MWNQAYREVTWNQIEQLWDVVVIGGGITGAGLLREAANAGLRCLLLEAKDFSFGTSSRSSKLVHGGFRYMRNRQFDVTRESVRERQWMLDAAPHLVCPLTFLMPNYMAYHSPDWLFHFGVILYDLFGHKWNHRSYSPKEILKLIPKINQEGMTRAFRYDDAKVDDARLVLRLIQEATRMGASALNYACVENLLRNRHGNVCGVVVHDESQDKGRTVAIHAKVVINATGPWTDNLRNQLRVPPRIRQTRGAHLVFSDECLPLNHALTLMHPEDRRAMFAIPWESVFLVGTTDLDHHYDLELEPYTSQNEIEYILQAVQQVFPTCEITNKDILSTFAGIRPIVASGKSDPSAESRAHTVWEEDGLYTITGGKLTTFRVMARDVLNAARLQFAGSPTFPTQKPIFNPLPKDLPETDLDAVKMLYLLGRHGILTPNLLLSARQDDLEQIEHLPNLWVEMRWAARAEGVIHLDDLLLRRVRIGLQLQNGGMHLLERIKPIVQSELCWDDERWDCEATRYQEIWQLYYSPSPGARVDLKAVTEPKPVEV